MGSNQFFSDPFEKLNLEVWASTLQSIPSQTHRCARTRPLPVITLFPHFPIMGFHVTSYKANFSSHPTRDHHVGFLLHGIGKCNKMSCYFLYSSNHITKLLPSDKNIKTHTQLKFQILLWSKSKVTAGFVAFLYTAPYKMETRRWGKIVCVKVHTALCKPSICCLTICVSLQSPYLFRSFKTVKLRYEDAAVDLW